MTLSGWAGFVGVLMIALAVPGPDFVVVVQAAVQGRRRGLLTAAGQTTALSLHACLAVVGLAALLAATPAALTAVRVVGAAVLVWLGVVMLRGWRAAGVDTDPEKAAGRAPYLRGFLTNATNPKAPLFFAAVMPQFIHDGPGRATETIVLAATVVVVAAAWWTLTVVVVRLLGLGRAGTGGGVTLLGGIVLVCLGASLAVESVLALSGQVGMA